MEIIKSHLKKPVVVIGLMGAGKTKIGGLLADALDLPFVDADQEIESAAGCSVSDIFEIHGETRFRDLERQVLKRLVTGDVQVIAPGGGAVMNEQTAELVFGNALTVWLRADLEVLLERTGRSDKRPLLRNGDPRVILQELMEKRYPVYGRADVTVQTEALPPENNLEKVIKALAAYLLAQDTLSP